MLGSLRTEPAASRPDLLAPAVVTALTALPLPMREQVHVAAIDDALADTAAFCAAYDVPASASANCVVVRGRRGGDVRTAACVVLATSRADVNGAVKRRLDVRKASFAATGEAVSETGMEFGGITPLGLPPGWPVLLDGSVLGRGLVVVGSGLRRSKLVLPGPLLAALPAAEVLPGLGLPLPAA